MARFRRRRRPIGRRRKTYSARRKKRRTSRISRYGSSRGGIRL